VRNAESLFNEARLITYAIYNIAAVNIAMVAFQWVEKISARSQINPFCRSLLIFPRAGPDIKYLLGFVRTQLSTSTTVVLVFGPKVSTCCIDYFSEEQQVDFAFEIDLLFEPADLYSAPKAGAIMKYAKFDGQACYIIGALANMKSLFRGSLSLLRLLFSLATFA
jgi:hypothetical protein